MGRMSGGRSAVLLDLFLVLVMAGCGPAAVGSPASPSSSGATQPPSAAGLGLTVLPTSFSGPILRGTKVLFLVTVGGDPIDGAATISVTSDEGLVWADPGSLLPNIVGEVDVLLGTKCPCTGEPSQRTVTITASRGSTQQTETRTMTVVDETKATPLEATDTEHIQTFVAWLARHRPELGITDTAGWNSVLGAWTPGVEHWFYLSKEWEVDLSWKTGASAPNDWARIALRRRRSEVAPSLAFQIDSISGKSVPYQIQAPSTIWR